MNPQEYIALFRSGCVPSQAITGLCGRILRGKKPEDFTTFTDDPLRKLVMVMGPDGLGKLLGKSGLEMLLEIGYSLDYIRQKIGEGSQFKLAVFSSGVMARLATWNNVVHVVGSQYPDVAHLLKRNFHALKRTGFCHVQEVSGFDWAQVDKIGPSDSRFMTHQRFRASSGTLEEARAFLYFTIQLRELFSGDGYAYTAQGRRGITEYMVVNRPISELGENQLIDLTVTFPIDASDRRTS